jgi:2-hydroxy-6-oxonona-2,4-dienedioate hydrolase
VVNRSVVSQPPVEPAEPPVEPDGRLVDADGLTYHVIELGPIDGRPTFFLHGGGPGCTAWSDFAPVAYLFAATRRCYFVDLLQYGKSAKCTINGPMWDFHARTIRDLMAALDVTRADFVCNSWGGTIALNLAANFPQLTRSLVVTGSMPVFYGPLAPLPENGRRGRKARDAYFGGSGPSWDKMKDLMAELEWFDRDRIPDVTVTRRYEQSINTEEVQLAARSDSPRGEWQDMTAELARIECPVLFAWGMHDAFLTPDYPLMLARMIRRGQLYVMDNASHHLQEECPQPYFSVVSGFLDQEQKSS